MDDSLGSAIEKIKRQEQNKEAKLKAQREFDAKKVALEKSIQDVISQAKKFHLEREELVKKTDELRAQLTIQEIRRDALFAQLKASKEELKKLRIKADSAISEVQEIRSNFCKVVHEVSEDYDIWALLMRPKSVEPMNRHIIKPDSNDLVLVNEDRLKNAMQRRETALAERNRLLSEPDSGEEFVRIKNALRYSMEMTANLKNEAAFKT